ncbi:hypothetical protein ACWDGI_41950 [Streptomyces sp. NPDC001220]
MLIIEVVQAVFIMALLVTDGRSAMKPLAVWTAVGFTASQILTGRDDGLADIFFRLCIAVFATIAIDRWRSEQERPLWLAGAACLLSGVLIGWVA